MYIFFMFKNNISKAIDWNYIQINDSQYHSASKLTDICRIDKKKIRRNTGALAWTSHKRTNLRPLFKRKKNFCSPQHKKNFNIDLCLHIFILIILTFPIFMQLSISISFHCFCKRDFFIGFYFWRVAILIRIILWISN